MSPHTVLVVDDDPALLRALTINLRVRGWEPLSAVNASEAVRVAGEHKPDVIVLDLGLPDVDGIELIRIMRRSMTTPIVVLSARHGGADKVDALDAGADDYVTKPFAVEELLARLRAAVRRAAPSTEEPEPVVRAGDLTIDLARRRVHRAGHEVRLTPTEWSMLEVLVRHRGHVVPSVRILQEVWGPTYRSEDNYLRVYAAQLRRKLEVDPSHPAHILTRQGHGYLFES